jgi:cytochrome c553
MRRAAGLAFLACCTAAPAADPPAPAKLALCTTCHGSQGISATPDAPHLAAQPRIYLEQQLRAFRSGARRHEVMNVVAKPLTDAEIEALAAWYAAIHIEVSATKKTGQD